MSDWKGTGLDDRLVALISAMMDIGHGNDDALKHVEAQIDEVIEAIVAAEREACAKIAEEEAEGLERTATKYGVPQLAHEYLVRATDARDLAAAIRARGKTE